MKQTILSKCFSKMKRFALTLFAALCAGSVWAGYLTFEAQNFAVSEDGTITFNANLGYHGTDTDRYAQLTAVGYNANGEVAFQETKVIGEELTELKLEEDGEGDGCVTYPCTIANSGLSATESYKIEFHFWAVKADGSLSADYDITRYVFPPVGITGVTAKYGDLKFRIFGNIESGYNISAIKVNYIVGTGTPNLVAYATIDAEAGTFACEIPYTPTEYTLTYKVTVEYADGTSKDYVDSATGVADLVKTRLKADTSKVIYTWTGEGDGTSWTDELNWTVNRDDVDTVGYPGTHDGSYYRTLFTITDDVECIDLKGGTYGFVDDGGMFIAANKTVKFKNGRFRFTSGNVSRTKADLSGSSSDYIGSNGGTLIFEKVTLRTCGDSGAESGYLAITPRTGATVAFEGTYTDNWDYYPKSAQTGTQFIIRDGELTLTRNLYNSANGSQNDVVISNAKWHVNSASTKTLNPFKSLTFRDGANRQAQFVNAGDLKLLGTYNFTLPEKPYSTPYYTLRLLASDDADTIKVDVTNYKGGGLVPLIKFTGNLNANTKTAMSTITTTASKLKVTANGEDVKAARNAKLVWNETAKTLYFQQDPVNAAEVAGVEYATFAEAFDAAQAGETVKLLKNTATAGFKIQKSVTLDLNGNTLTLTPPAVGSAGTETLGIQILAAAENVTIKNGTINVAEENLTAEKPIKMMINNYTNLALVNATLDGTNLVKPSNMAAYTLSNNSGTVTIDADSAIIAKEGGIAFDVCKYSTYEAPTVTVAEGATITGTVELSGGTLDAPEGITVGSGVADWVAKYVDGAWTLVESVKDPFVVAETRYATFAEALAAVEDGGTITVHENAEKSVYETPGFVLNKSVTIELNGRTLTLTPPAVGSTGTQTLGIQILPAAGREDAMNVTIKNGTINIAESNLTAEKPIKMMINNYVTGALTLEDVTLDGTNLVKPASSPIYVLSNNRGTVALTGETSIVAPEDAVAFDVCKYSTYTPPTVTLNTTGTIAGKVEVSGGAFIIGAENTATLSAIDFTAGSVKGDVESILTIPEDKKLVETEGVYTLTDKDVLAKVGDKLFETIDEAFAAAQAGDAVLLMKNFAVETVLEIPANVTLDLNGNELQALAVVGKLSMNGGALKTYDTNTQTFFFMAAPAETAGALYWTSDAVMTIGADYTLSLDGGSVTLPASWRSLLKQTLTIKSGASFVIPTGVELNLRGNAVVESGATLTCDGTIALGNTYDAVDTSATLTSAQLAEGKVVSAVEGYRPVYANGVYSLEEIPAEFAAQVGDVKYATLQAALDVEANLAATITLIANTKENVTVPAGFTGTIDLGGFTLTGRIDSYATGAVLKNGSVIHTTGSKAAIQIEAGSLELTDINMESNYHGVRLNSAGTTATINSGTYRITSSAGTYNLIYASKANAKFYVYGGEFYNNGDTGSTWVLKSYASGSEINVYGGTFSAYSANTFEVANGGVIKVFGGTFTGCNPSATTHATVQPGYAVEGTGPWTVVASWTAPMPDLEEGDSFSGDYEYTSEVLSALEAKAATSVDVKVNGVELKGDEAIKALNTAVASFEDALTFDGTAAILDIEIKVTEVNTEDPAASTVVVKRGTEELTVKATPTVKYFYPETKTWGSDKPESGAVLFKLVF